MTLFIVILAVFIVLILIWFFAAMPILGTRKNHLNGQHGFQGTLYAHRGLHDNETDAPENTLAAFKKAVDAGFGIELDVQLTKDNVPVVFHDYTLTRVCGVDLKVDSLTFDELQKYPICKSNERVPKFSDVLNLIDGKVPLIVEIKGESTDVSVCPLADELLRSYKGIYCIESFNPMALLWFKKNHPEVCRGQLSDCYLKEPDENHHGALYFVLQNLLLNFLTKPHFIAFNQKYTNSFNRKLCHGFYKNMAAAWTIKNQEMLDEAQGHFEIFIFDSFVPELR